MNLKDAIVITDDNFDFTNLNVMSHLPLLCGIAAGAIVVQRKWVELSIARDRVLDSDRFVLFAPRSAVDPSFELSNLRIESVGSKEFCQCIDRILYHGGSKVVSRLFTDPASLDFVVSEESRFTPNAIVEKSAAKHNVPVLNQQFLIDFVLSGRMPDSIEQYVAARITCK